MGDESVEGETVIKTVNKEVKIGEEEVVVDMMDAPRMFNGDILGFDAGADEGTDVSTSVDNLGTFTVREMSK